MSHISASPADTLALRQSTSQQLNAIDLLGNNERSQCGRYFRQSN